MNQTRPSLSSFRKTERTTGPAQVAARCAFAIGVSAVVVASLLPANGVPAIANDKIEHFVAYLLLSLLGVWSFRSWRASVSIALSLCALAVVLEIGQRFAPGRSPELADAIASCAGVSSAFALRWLGWPSRP